MRLYSNSQVTTSNPLSFQPRVLELWRAYLSRSGVAFRSITSEEELFVGMNVLESDSVSTPTATDSDADAADDDNRLSLKVYQC